MVAKAREPPRPQQGRLQNRLEFGYTSPHRCASDSSSRTTGAGAGTQSTEARRSACVLPGQTRPRQGHRGSGRPGRSLGAQWSWPHPQLYLRELLRLTHLRFYQHLVSLGEDGLQMLFCHRWLLLCFKREFPEAEALRIWEACWAHYQVSQGRRSPPRSARRAGRACVNVHRPWGPLLCNPSPHNPCISSAPGRGLVVSLVPRPSSLVPRPLSLGPGFRPAAPPPEKLNQMRIAR